MILHILLDIVSRSSSNLPYEKVGKNEPVCIADEVPFEIPGSWEWARLGNLCDTIGGYAFKSTEYKDKGIRVIRISDFDEEGLLYNDFKYYEESRDLDRYTVLPNDLLMCMTGGTVGKTCLLNNVEEKMYLNQRVAGIRRTSEELSVQYLYACIICPYIKEIIVSSKTSTNDNISMETINGFLIPIPPVNEQSRIIEKINEISPYIKRYGDKRDDLDFLNNSFPDFLRKSILQQAVMGKLVPQDENDEPAIVLLDRIRAEKQALIKAGKLKKDKHESIIYRRDNSHYEKRDGQEVCIDDEIPFEIPNTWEWARASSIGSMVRGKGIKRTETVPKGVPCVRYGEIYTSYNVSFSDTISFIDESLDVNCLHFSTGDIIFTLTGENKVDIAKGVAYLGNEKVAAGGDLAYWTAHGMNPLYLVYYMASPYCIERKRRTATGDIIVHISTDKVGSFLVPVPPLKEQERIVKAINRAFSKISAL